MQDYLQEFLDVKALEGCSKATIENYKFNLNKFLLGVGKDPTEITTQDIRKYLADYKRERGVSNTTLDNMRRVFQSFFTWMHREGYILKDPCAAVNKIRADKIIKNPYSDEEMENVIEMYSAKSNKYMGDFVATKLVEMCEAKGKVLIAK